MSVPPKSSVLQPEMPLIGWTVGWIGLGTNLCRTLPPLLVPRLGPPDRALSDTGRLIRSPVAAGRPATPPSRMRVGRKGRRDFRLDWVVQERAGEAPGGPVTCFPAEYRQFTGYCGEGARVRHAHCHRGQCVQASSAQQTQVLGAKGSLTETPELENPEGALRKSRSHQTQAPRKGCAWPTCLLWVGIHLLLKQLLSASAE